MVSLAQVHIQTFSSVQALCSGQGFWWSQFPRPEAQRSPSTKKVLWVTTLAGQASTCGPLAEWAPWSLVCRSVTRGHTGLALKLGWTGALAVLLVQGAAFSRVLGEGHWHMLAGVLMAGACLVWIVALGMRCFRVS